MIFVPHTLKLEHIVTYTLDSEGIARLDVEPENRAYWVETWLAMQPLLNHVESIILT